MNTKSDIIVSSLIIACSLALLGGLLMAMSGNSWQKPRLTFTIDFTDITGIRKSSAVYYSGDKVGVVQSVDHLAPADRLQEKLPVRLHISILKDIPIAAHLKATITAESFLSEKLVALSPIDDEGGLLAEGTHISSASSGGMLEMFLPGGDEIFTNIKAITADLKKVTAPLGKEDAGKKLTTTLANMESFTDELKKVLSGDDKTPGLTTKLKSMIDKLDHAAGGIKELIDGPTDDPDKGIKKRADAILANLQGFTNELNQMLAGKEGKAGLRDRLNGITDDIHIILAGPKGSPDKALQKRIDTVITKVDTLMEEMNALAVWGEYVTGTLAGKPSRLLFGNKKNDVPTKEQIIEHLRLTKQPYPVRIKEEELSGKGPLLPKKDIPFPLKRP